MSISSLAAIGPLEEVSRYHSDNRIHKETDNTESFDRLLESAMKLVNQTEDYTNAVEEEEVRYAMGETDSMHDLMIAQQKANVSLQYTVAVKNTAIEAYRSIMNMQF